MIRGVKNVNAPLDKDVIDAIDSNKRVEKNTYYVFFSI